MQSPDDLLPLASPPEYSFSESFDLNEPHQPAINRRIVPVSTGMTPGLMSTSTLGTSTIMSGGINGGIMGPDGSIQPMNGMNEGGMMRTSNEPNEPGGMMMLNSMSNNGNPVGMTMNNPPIQHSGMYKAISSGGTTGRGMGGQMSSGATTGHGMGGPSSMLNNSLLHQSSFTNSIRNSMSSGGGDSMMDIDGVGNGESLVAEASSFINISPPPNSNITPPPKDNLSRFDNSLNGPKIRKNRNSVVGVNGGESNSFSSNGQISSIKQTKAVNYRQISSSKQSKVDGMNNTDGGGMNNTDGMNIIHTNRNALGTPNFRIPGGSGNIPREENGNGMPNNFNQPPNNDPPPMMHLEFGRDSNLFLSECKRAYHYCMDTFQYSQAIWYAERMESEGGGEESNYLHALAHFHSHEPGQAYYKLRNSNFVNTLPKAQLLAAKCCYMLYRFQECIEILTQLIGMLKNSHQNSGRDTSVVPDLLPACYLLLGHSQETNGQRMEAATSFRRCLKLAPWMHEAYERLSWLTWSENRVLDERQLTDEIDMQELNQTGDVEMECYYRNLRENGKIETNRKREKITFHVTNDEIADSLGKYSTAADLGTKTPNLLTTFGKATSSSCPQQIAHDDVNGTPRGTVSKVSSCQVSGFEGILEFPTLAREFQLIDLNGTYTVHGQMHGRLVFVKDADLNQEGPKKKRYFIYYWDRSAGEGNQGWWIGSEIGGAEIYARAIDMNPSNKMASLNGNPTNTASSSSSSKPVAASRNSKTSAGYSIASSRPQSKGFGPSSRMPSKTGAISSGPQSAHNSSRDSVETEIELYKPANLPPLQNWRSPWNCDEIDPLARVSPVYEHHLNPWNANDKHSSTAADTENLADGLSHDGSQGLDQNNNPIFTLACLLSLLRRATSELHNFETSRCLGILEKLPQRHYETPSVLDMVARCFFEESNYKRCAAIHKKILNLDQKRVKGLEQYSTCLWHLKKSLELAKLAHDCKDSQADWGSKPPQLWCVFGNSFSLAQEHDTAISFFKRAIQLDPYCVFAYVMCGHEYTAQDKLDKAIPMFEQALSIDPRSYTAWWALGNVNLRQEQYDSARYHFLKAVEINKKNKILRCYLGMALEQLKNPKLALEYFERASCGNTNAGGIAGASGNISMIQFQKASVLMDLERFEDALEALTYVERLNPQEPRVHFQIAKVSVKLGFDQKAMIHFNKAMELNRDSKDYHTIKTHIERLHLRNEETSTRQSGDHDMMYRM